MHDVSTHALPEHTKHDIQAMSMGGHSSAITVWKDYTRVQSTRLHSLYIITNSSMHARIFSYWAAVAPY